MLLYEYYVYKIRNKEIEKENKAVKALAEYLRKQVKLTRETTLDQVLPCIEARPDFASMKLELRKRALEHAVKEALRREVSESSSYEEHSHGSSSRHYSKSGRKRHHRHHRHSRRSVSPSDGKASLTGRRRSRSRSRSGEKPVVAVAPEDPSQAKD